MMTLVLALYAAIAAAAALAETAPGDPVQTFDAPCRYPAGITFSGDHLYVLDWRDAQIHEVAPTDGNVIRTFAAPTLRPQGLTAAPDGRLYVSDDRSGWVYRLNTADGMVEDSFEAPGPQPAGLAWADDTLYLLEQTTDKIYQVLPEDGTILKVFAAPTKSCSTLAFDGTYLWAADRVKNEFYVIAPANGEVVTLLAAPGPYPAGIAVHDGDLWNVDFQQRKLYRLRLRADRRYRLSDIRTARVEFMWDLYNYGPNEVRSLSVNVALPENLPQQELLTAPEFCTPPTRIATDRWGQRCAVFEVDVIGANERRAFGYQINARIAAIRYVIFPEDCGTLADIPPEIRDAYTANGSRYRFDTPFMQETVKQIVGDERNPYWIARKIFDHLIQKVDYEMVGGWDVPEVVLQRGSGSCSEYTFAFIALCRAAGLPARYQGSVVVRGDDASIDDAYHRWAEIYLPHYGWVPVDPSGGDHELPADQARAIGGLANRFLITTQSGGGSELLAWDYNAYATWQATGYCKVAQEGFGFWEPLLESASSAPVATEPPVTPERTPAAGGGNTCEQR